MNVEHLECTGLLTAIETVRMHLVQTYNYFIVRSPVHE